MGAAADFFNTVVDGERRQGIPDEQIARDLGISVERLRELYPPRPRGHAGNPFAGVVPLPPSSPGGSLSAGRGALSHAPRAPDDGAALLVLFLLLGG